MARHQSENFGAAIVTVGAQKDFGARPVGADGAQQPAQEGSDFLAAGPLGGAQHGGDEAARAVEHHDRLKSVFVVMGVEQPELLAAVNRVERVVEVERDPLGNLAERRAIEIDHGAAHPQQRAGVGQVFQSGDRRLRAQLALGRRRIHCHLERRVAAKTRGVVAVFVAGADHQQPKANDVGQAVGDLLRRARINQAGGQPIGDAKAPLDLAQRQNPAVRRQQAAIEFDHHRLAARR